MKTTTTTLLVLSAAVCVSALPGASMSALDRAHGFKTPKSSDSRSPCPMLNVLANHGYLPHDGKNITPFTINQTVQNVLNFDATLGNFLTSPILTIMNAAGTIDLEDLALHGFIEHDASLTRDDTPEGSTHAPTTINPVKVKKLLGFASPQKTFTFLEFSKARADAELISPIPAEAATVAAGEPSLILNAFGKGTSAGGLTSLTVTKAQVESIMSKERLPSDFVKQASPVSLQAIGGLRVAIVAKIAEIKAATAAV